MQLDKNTLQQRSDFTGVYCLHLYPTNVPKLLLPFFKQTEIMQQISVEESTQIRLRIMKTKLDTYYCYRRQGDGVMEGTEGDFLLPGDMC
jgi:hypothetical protein